MPQEPNCLHQRKRGSKGDYEKMFHVGFPWGVTVRTQGAVIPPVKMTKHQSSKRTKHKDWKRATCCGGAK